MTAEAGTFGSVIEDTFEVFIIKFGRLYDELPSRRGGDIDYCLWLVNGLEEGDSCDGIFSRLSSGSTRSTSS